MQRCWQKSDNIYFNFGNVAKAIVYQRDSRIFAPEIQIKSNLKSTIMGIFNFLSKKHENNSAMTVSLPVADNLDAETSDVLQETNGEPEAKKPLTVSYATGWPIDVIYGYLHKNYEEQGLRDAMTKSDLAFRDLNMDIIRNKILMVFREINLNYDVMKSDLESRIDTCRAAGLLTTVSDIDKTLTIIKTHKEELRQLEEDFRNNANEASIPLKSYDCGFLRGVATIALSSSGNSVAMPASSVQLPYAKETA